MTTLAEHVKTLTGPDGDGLGRVIAALAEAGKTIAAQLSRAALVGMLGTTGSKNVQGETVKKLDAWSNDIVVDALRASGRVATMVSEEMDDPVRVSGVRDGYVACFDPVDGSSNLDVNGIVGTIFSIRRATGDGDHVQAGTTQVAAGYIMFGPSTLLVLTTGDGVDGFTVDPDTGAFTLSYSKVRMPSRGKIYSTNEGNTSKWEPGVKRWVEHLKASDGATGRPYTARYVGSFVADMHRTLLEGGIYCYPAETAADPKSVGKLRLQYEGAPMAMIAEQAGGRATTGRERILDIKPTTHHQRVPVFIGSADDVALAEEFIAGRR